MTLLLREAIGGTIRRARTERRRTLRDVSKDARVSLGYLSEIERGRKEPSSELLAAICEALSLPLPDLLDDVADALRPGPAVARRLVGVDPALRSAVEEAFEGAGEAAGDTGDAAVPAAGEVVDLAEVPGPDDAGVEPFGDAEPETVEPAGELRLVGLVTVAHGVPDTIRSAA